MQGWLIMIENDTRTKNDTQKRKQVTSFIQTNGRLLILFGPSISVLPTPERYDMGRRIEDSASGDSLYHHGGME